MNCDTGVVLTVLEKSTLKVHSVCFDHVNDTYLHIVWFFGEILKCRYKLTFVLPLTNSVGTDTSLTLITQTW